MSHDPLCCQSQGKWDGGCQCALITKVRADRIPDWSTSSEIAEGGDGE